MQTEKVWTLDDVKADWARVKCEFAYLRMIAAAHRLINILRAKEEQKRADVEQFKFNPGQPRVPAGNGRESGQWAILPKKRTEGLLSWSAAGYR